MIRFAVTENKQKLLLQRMAQLGVREEDFAESFIRSSGCGGQHVNKTATAVHLVHCRTGLEVKCMRERSQSVNRFLARRELLEKIAAAMGLPTAVSAETDRIRRRKSRARRRSSAKKEEK
jgi:protein subunit release factor B